MCVKTVDMNGSKLILTTKMLMLPNARIEEVKQRKRIANDSS
jgi:hypothetical protein